MKYLLCRDGGFLVCSDAGNWAYAYPTSPHAAKAKRNPGVVASKMAAEADRDARTCSGYILDEHNRHLSQSYDAELIREPQL